MGFDAVCAGFLLPAVSVGEVKTRGKSAVTVRSKGPVTQSWKVGKKDAIHGILNHGEISRGQTEEGQASAGPIVLF